MLETKIAAHAGFNNIKDNSEESIKTAVKLELPILEFDVRLYKGELYLKHDEVKEKDLETLVTFKRGLELVKDTELVLNCDAKGNDIIPYALDIINQLDMGDKYFFTGNCPGDIIKKSDYKFFVNTESGTIFGKHLLIDEKKANELVAIWDGSENPNFLGYNIYYRNLTERGAEILTSAKIPLICWTVDKEKELDKLIGKGLYAITTNNVSYAKKIF